MAMPPRDLRCDANGAGALAYPPQGGVDRPALLEGADRRKVVPETEVNFAMSGRPPARPMKRHQGGARLEHVDRLLLAPSACQNCAPSHRGKQAIRDLLDAGHVGGHLENFVTAMARAALHLARAGRGVGLLVQPLVKLCLRGHHGGIALQEVGILVALFLRTEEAPPLLVTTGVHDIADMPERIGHTVAAQGGIGAMDPLAGRLGQIDLG